jgi:hypothetical protein
MRDTSVHAAGGGPTAVIKSTVLRLVSTGGSRHAAMTTAKLGRPMHPSPRDIGRQGVPCPHVPNRRADCLSTCVTSELVPRLDLMIMWRTASAVLSKRRAR